MTENPETSPVDWPRVAKLVLTSRAIDDLEETQLAPTSEVTYQFSARGHELAQVLLGLSLDHQHDGAAVYYRSRPFMLACGLSPEEALAADLARTGSPSEGRDVGVVYSMASRGGVTVLPGSGDVGAQYTPAAGWAQAIMYYSRHLKDQAWDRAVAVVLGGDGSVASNGFWAALSMATTLKLPLLFFIEDNGYGLSVPSHFQTPGGDIAANLASFQEPPSAARFRDTASGDGRAHSGGREDCAGGGGAVLAAVAGSAPDRAYFWRRPDSL